MQSCSGNARIFDPVEKRLNTDSTKFPFINTDGGDGRITVAANGIVIKSEQTQIIWYRITVLWQVLQKIPGKRIVDCNDSCRGAFPSQQFLEFYIAARTVALALHAVMGARVSGCVAEHAAAAGRGG